ncbi:MAG TPA: ATP-binding protein, partial [Myxococcales bacterium]|nr:ATP-binding protein [Myxococcales bacterium]
DNDADADAVVSALAPNSASTEVLRVSRLADGLSHLNSAKIDLVVLDLSLPDSWGLTGLQRIRAHSPAVPVVVLTGMRDDRVCAQALQDGAQDYLVKGDLDASSLAQRVRDALQRQLYQVRSAQLAEEKMLRVSAEEAERRAQWRVDVGNLLSASLELDETVQNIVRAAVPAFADGCSLQVGEVPQANELLLQVARSGKPLFDRVTGRSMMVPLLLGNRSLGALELTGKEPRRPFGSIDRMQAEEFGRRAALALENARLYQNARSAVGLRDEFLSIASHELRTPLSSLQMQIQLLQLRAKNGRPATLEEQKTALDTCARQTQRLARLVDTLLDVSLIASGQLTLAFEELELTAVVRDTVERLRDEPNAANTATLRFEPGPAVHGSWDRLRVEQVLTNLLTNAVKYGGGTQVTVALRSDQTHAVLSVSDGGIGIAASDLVRIFGRFERAAPIRNYSGLGLGLYVTRQIVEAHGGTVEVQSNVGKGSCFTVRLPLTQRQKHAN